MIIKICGMRNADNIRAVEQLGADWMGFIFYPGSPRYAGNQLTYLPERMKRVGVFVDEAPEKVTELAAHYRLQLLQLHGSEPPDVCRAFRLQGYRVIKVFGVESGKPFPAEQIQPYEGSCDFFLFDTGTPQYGGSGKKFCWELLSDYRGKTPFLLSGGITPDDADAVRAFSHPQFAGIDLNSGFETAPAMKAVVLLKLFLYQIRHEQD
ncbi:MAG: phosphoribosylanthranilate isomerase [Proteiniphilum sp.]|nr:phosphoribosylanthranilate isomerase [Proteiniphilum sp.]MDD4799985.1 phosphoribosylanthranilate isomerase [Proteiniphilum sp.]